MLQRSPEWVACRLGKCTASRVADVCAKTKSGYGASRANYLAELLIERLTQAPIESFVSAAMARGTDLEPSARIAYELHTEAWVSEVGFLEHPTIPMSGCSPDGRIGDDGLVEIKCMGSGGHLDFLLTRSIPDRYYRQMMFQMAVTGCAWCDFAAYNPDFPDSMKLSIKKVERDDAMIADLEKQVIAFLEELDAKLCALRSAYDLPAVLKESAVA